MLSQLLFEHHAVQVAEFFYSRKTYCDIEETTGHPKQHSDTEAERLSRYRILSHQAGMRFFSPESYPTEQITQD